MDKKLSIKLFLLDSMLINFYYLRGGLKIQLATCEYVENSTFILLEILRKK